MILTVLPTLPFQERAPEVMVAGGTYARSRAAMRTAQEYLARARVALQQARANRGDQAALEMLQIAEDYMFLAGHAAGAEELRAEIDALRNEVEMERV